MAKYKRLSWSGKSQISDGTVNTDPIRKLPMCNILRNHRKYKVLLRTCINTPKASVPVLPYTIVTARYFIIVNLNKLSRTYVVYWIVEVIYVAYDIQPCQLSDIFLLSNIKFSR